MDVTYITNEGMGEYWRQSLRPATLHQADLTGTPNQVRLSGLPHSVCAP
jgi:hypothetical protein